MGNSQKINFKAESPIVRGGTDLSIESIGLEIIRSGHAKETVSHTKLENM